MPLVEPGRDGQKLDHGDAEAGQVADRGRMAEAGEGAALRLRNIGIELGEAADMQLVDHLIGERRCGSEPVRGGERPADDALRHDGGAVALVGRRAETARVIDQRILAKGPVDGFRVRIDEQLGRVEAQPFLRSKRPMGAQAVARAGADPGDMAEMDIAAARGQRDALNFSRAVIGEEAEFDPVGGGMNGNIDAGFLRRHAERRGQALADNALLHRRQAAAARARKSRA